MHPSSTASSFVRRGRETESAGARWARGSGASDGGAWQNAMKYNPDGHDVHMMAKKLLVAPPAPLHPYRGRCFAVWQQGWRGTERADRRRVLHAWRQVMLENKWDRESAEIQKKFTGAPSGGGGGQGGRGWPKSR